MSALSRFLVLVLLLIAVACRHDPPPNPASGTRFESRYAFVLVVPPEWVVLDPSHATDVLDGLRSDPQFSGFDRGILDEALRKVKSGEFEFLFRQPLQEFTENIAIRERAVTIPSSAEALSKACEGVPASVREAFGREVEAPLCRLSTVAGFAATYAEVEGPVPGTVSLQYQVQRSERSAIVFTASILSENLAARRGEFESIVRSIEFD